MSGNTNSALCWSALHHPVVDCFPLTTVLYVFYSLLSRKRTNQICIFLHILNISYKLLFSLVVTSGFIGTNIATITKLAINHQLSYSLHEFRLNSITPNQPFSLCSPVNRLDHSGSKDAGIQPVHPAPASLRPCRCASPCESHL